MGTSLPKLDYHYNHWNFYFKGDDGSGASSGLLFPQEMFFALLGLLMFLSLVAFVCLNNLERVRRHHIVQKSDDSPVNPTRADHGSPAGIVLTVNRKKVSLKIWASGRMSLVKFSFSCSGSCSLGSAVNDNKCGGINFTLERVPDGIIVFCEGTENNE